MRSRRWSSARSTSGVLSASLSSATDTMSVAYADFKRLVEPTLTKFADPPRA